MLKDIDTIIIECACGNTWDMDSEPTPESCIGDVWRLNLETIRPGDSAERSVCLGVWVDVDGNPVSR